MREIQLTLAIAMVNVSASLRQNVGRTAIAAATAVVVFLCSAASASPIANNATPGVVVAHSPAKTAIYLGSPAIAILDDGTYVITHDTFGPNSSLDTTEVYRSHDRGRSWAKLADVKGQYFSSVFVHRGALYLIGTSRLEGAVVIRRSLDDGKTWSVPTDANSGVLASDGKYFSAATPIVTAGGRLWKSMETINGGVAAGLISADVNSDLCKAGSWTFTAALRPDSQWLDGKFKGWLEGNAVVTPEGKVVDVLRVYYDFQPEQAAIVTVDEDERHLAFDPKTGFVAMPGAGKKFTIRFDPSSGLYWSLTNAVLPGSYHGNNFERARNTLALISSSDLHRWDVRRVVLHADNSDTHGYQYVDWVFDGSDIAAAIRTASDDDEGGAHSQHDSNFVTFLRVSNFAHP